MHPDERIDLAALPKHIAIIMDGNGRWARTKGNVRIFGHRSAIKAVRETTETTAELGIPYLTLYAFSTENWGRPKAEVEALMMLLVDTIRKETSTLLENDIRLRVIGKIEDLPARCRNALFKTMELTRNNSRMTLTLALSYGARQDISEAMTAIGQKVSTGEISVTDIDEKLISNHLSTAYMPDPELIIRTSGEFRISNFLLWEIAYSEIYITDKFWPDFRKEDLYQAIVDFQHRERRFGMISEQIHK